MNKSIFVTLAIGVIAATMIASTIVTSDVLADTQRDRTNNNVNQHIAAGGAHGEEAQKWRIGGEDPGSGGSHRD